MRKIFGVAGAIALSIIPNPVFSEDMPPIPNPGSCEIPIRSEEWRRDPWHIKNISEFGGKIEVVRTIFPGNDKLKMGLYEFKATKSSGSEIYGGLVISGMGLQPGDTISEKDAIRILDIEGREFSAYRDVIGMYYPFRKKNVALLYYKNGVLLEQGLMFFNRDIVRSLRSYGKPCKPKKSFCYYEEKMDYDFNGNLIIGCN